MLEITNIRNGAVLNNSHGCETENYLEVQLNGIADPMSEVRINGELAQRHDRVFSLPVRLSEKINEITVTARNKFGRFSQDITVVWDKKSFKRYNFFIDDNIFFLAEIAKELPASLFDHFYLKELREMHRKYGTKFTLNCFYNNDHFPFTLDAFPDRYKSEWLENSDWLKLSFHAYSEFPDRPYQRAVAEKLAADYDLVKNEIVRFAGEKTFISPTVIHWAMAMPDVFHVLKERGVKTLSGQYISSRTFVGENVAKNPFSDIGYFYEQDVSHYMACAREFYDPDFDLFLVKGSVTCNLDAKDTIVKKLTETDQIECGSKSIGMATHEQYSFKFYHNYIPDHFERMDLACKTLSELGYSPVFFSEGIYGNKAWD